MSDKTTDRCLCHRCGDARLQAAKRIGLTGADLLFARPMGMVVCPTCGNKRCPKASDHRLACTASNEPGQKGSIYA